MNTNLLIKLITLRRKVNGMNEFVINEMTRVFAENDDGSIYCKLPIKSLKLSIIERELTDEQREEMSKRFKKRMED